MLFSIFSLENASQIGFRISGEIVPLSYQGQRSPKRANGSERAINPGVQGLAPGPFSPFLGRNGDPCRAGGAPGASAPRGWLPRHPLRGHAKTGLPLAGGGLGPAQGKPCDVVPRPVPGRGSRLSLEKARTRSRGGCPPPPGVRARSFPLARFGGCCPGSVRGAVSSDMLRPIWDAFSSKKYAEKAFYERKSPNQGTKMGGEIAP